MTRRHYASLSPPSHDLEETPMDPCIETLAERVRCLEESVASNNVPTRHDSNDELTAAYQQQIEMLTRDFYREREEREKLVCKVDTLQMLLKRGRERYQKLYYDTMAIQNGDDTSARESARIPR